MASTSTSGVQLNGTDKVHGPIHHERVKTRKQISSVCVYLCLALLAAIPGQASVLSGYSALPATATVVDFDDQSFGFTTEIRNQYASLGVVFGGNSYPGLNLINGNLPQYIPGDRSPNALQVVPWNNSDGGAPLDIEFSVPVTGVGFSYEVAGFGDLELKAYNSDNVLLEDVIYTATSGFAGLRETQSIAHLDLISHDLRFGTPYINFGMDTLQFAGPTVATPEPTSTALIASAGGLLLLFLAGRRSRRILLDPGDDRVCWRRR
jgi:hypothetical protein